MFLIKVVLMKKRVHVYETRTNGHSAAREIVIEQQISSVPDGPTQFLKNSRIVLKFP